MIAEPERSADAESEDCELIEVHVPRVEQLFNAIDPSPLHEKDLDARVEAFIVSWAREARPHARLELVVHVDEPSSAPDPEGMVRDAVGVLGTGLPVWCSTPRNTGVLIGSQAGSGGSGDIVRHQLHELPRSPDPRRGR